MSDEAFALSPISARPAQPSEADYDAIREAFMETSRGRWFLGEYAKRNRNADTRLVLDAVARIEETLAAQKKPPRDPLLDEALAAVRRALGEAKDATHAALLEAALEENLAPVRKGARVIREIAWRLREIGADSRICDLIDSQVSAIEGAAAKVTPGDLAAALSGAFGLVEARISAFEAADLEMAVPPPEAALQEARDEAAAPATDPMAEPAQAAASPATPLAEGSHAAPTGDAAQTGAVIGERGAVESGAKASAAQTEAVDAFTADDEAVLDRVALEMAAFDTDAAYEPPMEEMAHNEAAQSPTPPLQPPSTPAAEAPVAAEKADIPVDDIEITFVTDANGRPIEPAGAAAIAIAVEADVEAKPVAPPAAPIEARAEAIADAEPAASLGASLIANGVVQRPRSSKPDPLAPIRRMSQSEKIAFFS